LWNLFAMAVCHVWHAAQPVQHRSAYSGREQIAGVHHVNMAESPGLKGLSEVRHERRPLADLYVRRPVAASLDPQIAGDLLIERFPTRALSGQNRHAFTIVLSQSAVQIEVIDARTACVWQEGIC